MKINVGKDLKYKKKSEYLDISGYFSRMLGANE